MCMHERKRMELRESMPKWKVSSPHNPITYLGLKFNAEKGVLKILGAIVASEKDLKSSKR